MKRPALIALGLAGLGLAAAGGIRLAQVVPYPTPTGKVIRPAPPLLDVGSFPVRMKLSPDGKWLVVTDCGYRQQLTVIDARTLRIASRLQFKRGRDSQSLYWGLAFHDNRLYVSRGPEEKVSVYEIQPDGSLHAEREFETPSRKGAPLANFVAGLAVDGQTLYAANNESGPSSDWQGTVSEIDLASGEVRGRVLVGGFPLDCEAVKDAKGATQSLFVTSEQDGQVCVFQPGSRVADQIRVGTNPTALLVRGNQVYVANSGSDSISVIDAQKQQVSRTVLVRPAEARGLPTCTPLGMDLSADGSTLFVALADMNAVGVVDAASGKVRGYIPTGWYPTDVKLSRDGKRLFVSCAKGDRPRVPNQAPYADRGTYILNLLEGCVSAVEVDQALRELPQLTRQSIADNGLAAKPSALRNPGIRHVIYIIKENRTYDNVLGDLPGGNGDPSICLFPREVTPNQHALAERFALLDNFYCCAEVSGDGWNWSTAGMASEYVSRNVPFNYSGRGRDYDFEGTVNGGKPENDGAANVARPAGGYIWDLCRKNRVSFRNYGFFVGESDAQGVRPGITHQATMAPVLKALEGVTDPDFNQFDMDYPDSDINREYGIVVASELRSFGNSKATSRFAEWKREFDQCVKNGNLPQLSLVRLCRDHTAGTAAGKLTPRGMVADNDYAVGRLVEEVSKSRYWKDTVICVLEDDAQSGMDHVDCHRSIAFVVSPYVRRGLHYSAFGNTDSMLRTMELLLGLPPMNGYDLVARPLDVFDREVVNPEPYTAIKPSREISGAVNQANAYRSGDSARLARHREDSDADVELNDILWGSTKGAKAQGHGPLP